MRIVHFAQFGPRACGLYGTARDLIAAERKAGADAHLVDIRDDGQSRVGLRDGEIETVHPDYAYDADVLVRHTAITPCLQNAGIPIVMAVHGRPESSWRQYASGNDVIEALSNKAHDARYRKFITFWPEFMEVWKTIIPADKLCYVPPPVDLDYYAGGTDLKLAGSPKILIADVWRDDIVPLDSLIAAVRYIERCAPGGKIHIVGLPGGKALRALHPLLNGWSKQIGSAAGQISNIRDYYASCDVLVTPHAMATRTIREGLAAGCPVVAGDACRYTRTRADPKDYQAVSDAIAAALDMEGRRTKAKEAAALHFDPMASARDMLGVCESACEKRTPKTKKLLLDIGAHVGETVHRFYRERPDAGQFDIYCFEPDPEAFKLLCANVGHIPNVACVNKALTGKTERRQLARGSVNDGEGNTLLAGKRTGGVDYGRQIEVDCTDISWWLSSHPADVTLVKMNVEGCEYELLPRLIQSGAMGRVTELYCQTHSIKFDLAERMRMDAVESQFREDVKRFETIVKLTTKGMASFAQ